MQSARIVTHVFTALAFYSHAIFFLVQTLNAPVLPRFDSKCIATSGITHNVTRLVLPNPQSVRSGDFLACYKYSVCLLFRADSARVLHRSVDRFVNFFWELIVGRD